MNPVSHPLHLLDRVAMLAVRAMVALSKSEPPGPEGRKQFDEMMEKTPAADGVTCHEAEAGGVPGWWCRPDEAMADAAILYLHGGAYILGSARAYRHLAGQIAVRAKAAAFVADYGKAPKNPFPAAVNDARAAYRGLAEQGFAKIAVAGDSAGGGLALSLLALATAEANRSRTPSPAAAAVLSPWTDLALTGATMETEAKSDPLLTKETLADSARQYLGGANARDPRASPLYGELAGLPAVRIHVGSDEILLDDALRYGERLEGAGGTCQVHVWEGMTHVFPSHLSLRAAQEALDDTGEFLQRQLSKTN